jgi:hypothetical protein
MTEAKIYYREVISRMASRARTRRWGFFRAWAAGARPTKRTVWTPSFHSYAILYLQMWILMFFYNNHGSFSLSWEIRICVRLISYTHLCSSISVSDYVRLLCVSVATHGHPPSYLNESARDRLGGAKLARCSVDTQFFCFFTPLIFLSYLFWHGRQSCL